MKLLIVESPNKTKTIGKFLDSEYKVVACYGHVRELPKSEKEAIDIENNFAPKYVSTAAKRKIISSIQKEASSAQEILLAMDPDREGEAIAWHLKELINHKNKNIKRITFNEITKPAILCAIESPREININLKYAQEARRVMDRLFGYTLSKLVWSKVRYGLSAGRVQSAVLRILMERQRSITSFIPVEYYLAIGTLKKTQTKQITVTSNRLNADDAEKLQKMAPQLLWILNDIKATKRSTSPPPPFMTSTLQQSASTELNFTPTKTMTVSSKLYEKGHITYIRTDSTRISKSFYKEIEKDIIETYGKEYHQKREYITKRRTTQEAHECIRPTKLSPCKLIGDELSIYNLIYSRLIASQMIDNIKSTKTYTFTADTVEDVELPHLFYSQVMDIQRGWHVLMSSQKVIFPIIDINIGDKLNCSKLHIDKKETEGPNFYSQSSIILEMEKREIGRPSTYAPIVATIIKRGYASVTKKALIPTALGGVISSFLEEHFPTYIADDFTRDMEEKLDEIANGSRNYVDTLSDFYTPFLKEVESKKDLPKQTVLSPASEEIRCPMCESSMVKKLSKIGIFLSCSKFPACSGARKENGANLIDTAIIETNCPNCKKGKLTNKISKFGIFIACTNYPKCKYIDSTKESNASSIECPVCASGNITEKKGRFGKFFACSNYPNCKYSLKSEPTGEKCRICSKLIMKGTKTIPNRCSSKDCVMYRPDKLNK